MRAGRLDRRVTIQRKSDTLNDLGEQVSTWVDLVFNEPASVTPIRGDERFTATQWIAKDQKEFRIRFFDAVANLTPLDRIIYPVSSTPNDQSPPFSSIYDAMAVNEIGRREGLQIMAARHADVVTP